MLSFDGIWHFGEVFSSWMNPGFHCTGQMADSVYGVVCERFTDVNVEDRVAHVRWCMDKEHRCHFLMAFESTEIR